MTNPAATLPDSGGLNRATGVVAWLKLLLTVIFAALLIPGLFEAQEMPGSGATQSAPGGIPSVSGGPAGAAGSAQAAGSGKILGRVLDGTTGKPSVGQEVRLLMPRQGMAVVGTAKTGSGGIFQFSGVEAGSGSFYLLETIFQGARFHAPVVFKDGPTANVELTVYEPTSSASVIRVQALEILVAAAGSKARVRDEYHVQNSSQPPRAYADPKGTFRFTVPEGISPQVTVVGLLKMPLPQTPEAGKSPGEYVIHYPLEPGVTTVSVEYNTSYSASGLTVTSKVPYPIERADLFVFPSNLKVAASPFEPAGTDSKNNIAGFEATNLAGGKTVEIAVSGEAPENPEIGSGGSTEAEGSEAEPQVKIVSDPISGLAGPILGCFLLVLLWAFGVRLAKEWPRLKQRTSASGQKPFGAKAEKLLNSVADLDELFAAGKVAEKDYWKERLELKARLIATLRKRGPLPAQEPYASRRTPR